MVEAGGGGLDPLEPAIVADFVPIDGDFGVAAEDVGGGELGGGVFLAGVDDLVTGGGGPDLGKVTRLDEVAEDEALFGRWRIGIAWHTIGCCQRSPVLARATRGGHCPPKVNAFKKLVGGAHPTRLSLRIRGSFSLASAARESRAHLLAAFKSMIDRRRILGSFAVFALVVLRLVIGWHFFGEGTKKLQYDRQYGGFRLAFSADRELLALAKGPLADLYLAHTPYEHGWRQYIATPRENAKPTAEQAAAEMKWQRDYRERQAAAEKKHELAPVE